MVSHRKKVLIVEDEPSLVEAIRYQLEREGFEVASAEDGSLAIQLINDWMPDAVLLDLMLPNVSGLEVLRLVRGQDRPSILIVSAKDSETEKVLGLEMGADDYITKPFAMRELVARLRAVLRRSRGGSPEHVLRADPVEIDLERHEVSVRGQRIVLTPKEFAVLEMLVERSGKLVTRDRLLSEVWGYDYVGDTRTLDVHIKRLRSKIEEDPANPRLLKTLRGLGYKFEPDSSSTSN